MTIQATLHTTTPCQHTIYTALGVEESKHGQGFALIPQPPRGGEPRVDMNTLIVLAMISAARKCLLGYEVAAMLKGNFHYYRNTTDCTPWLVRIPISTPISTLSKYYLQARLFRALLRTPWFKSLQAPGHLTPAERIWYIDYCPMHFMPLPTSEYLEQLEKRNKRTQKIATQ